MNLVLRLQSASITCASPYLPSHCTRPKFVVLQIDVLKAGWCKIGEKDGAKAIADLILFNTTLTTLDLRGNGLSNPGDIAHLNMKALV